MLGNTGKRYFVEQQHGVYVHPVHYMKHSQLRRPTTKLRHPVGLFLQLLRRLTAAAAVAIAAAAVSVGVVAVAVWGLVA